MSAGHALESVAGATMMRIMPYTTEWVANAVLARGFNESRGDITPMKLQKLLWFLNGWHLAVTGAPAVSEPFSAWKFGPVLPTIYHHFKRFGDSPITEYAKTYDGASGEFKAFTIADSATTFYEILDLTWEKYIGFDGIQLSSMTHMADTPWRAARSAGADVIDSGLIKNYFIGLARHTTRSAPAAARPEAAIA